MPKAVTTYTCEVCNTEFATLEKALACEASKPEPLVEVGDIVLVKAGFGWFDGDVRWVSNPEVRKPRDNGPHIVLKPCPQGDSNCFGPCCCYSFYYVVTAIDIEKDRLYRGSEPGHRLRYHVATKAMSGEAGYRSGWTAHPGHYKPVKVKNPPKFVVADSRDLIGKTFENLL